MSDPAYELRGAGLRLGPNTALAGLDLTLEPGERVAVVGASGAGKSSLLSLLNGSRRPTEGEVLVLGHRLDRLGRRARRAVQRRIGTVHQQLHLVGPLAVVHNVNAGRLGAWSAWHAALSLVAPRDTARVRGVLDSVGIAEKLFEPTEDLSGGEQQRVAIARVLLQEPDVMLADEPIASLDGARGRAVVDLLVGLSRRRGSTLVVGLHDVDVALDSFDRVLGLRGGRLVLDRPADRVGPDELAGVFGPADAVRRP